MSEFLIGEYVERIFDNAVGIITEIQEYDGGLVYKVDFKRMEGDEWIGAPSAWRRHHRVHAHVTTRSRDCVGEYSRGHVDVTTIEERCRSYGDQDFMQRVISSVVSVYAEQGTLKVTKRGAHWYERTEEGYTSTTIKWCEDDCTNDKAWFRAEEAGY